MRLNNVRRIRGIASALVLIGSACGAMADAPKDRADARVDITVVPVASLQFTTPNVLALSVPPSKSTVNTAGAVKFIVTGNAKAILSAAPDRFIQIPGPGNGWMGKATKGGDAIGYQVQLTFPNNDVLGSPRQVALESLGSMQGTPPLSVDLPLTGGVRPGTVDLYASGEWTPDGGLPLPGLYAGQIVLTLTADSL